MIFERRLFATIRSFKPSPFKSAACNRPICWSIGKISGPLKAMPVAVVLPKPLKRKPKIKAVRTAHHENFMPRNLPSADALGQFIRIPIVLVLFVVLVLVLVLVILCLIAAENRIEDEENHSPMKCNTTRRVCPWRRCSHR